METQELYMEYRPLLFTLAYRMLGSVMDAEDVVQGTFLAFAGVGEERKEQVSNVQAYLCKMATNRCLDLLRSAKHRREVYVGTWLPEPVVLREEQEVDEPLYELLRRDDLSTAYLMLMETLSPEERAIFVLREAYQYSYAEISEHVAKGEANCRKIYSRIKIKLGPQLADARADYHQDLATLNRFLAAFAAGDVDQLLELLSADVTLYSDGGGKATAAIRPIVSAPHVLAFLQGVAAKSGPDSSVELVTINGQPGLLFLTGGQVHTTLCFRQKAGRMQNIYLMRNPDKLAAIGVNLYNGKEKQS
ncbi:hypothetical protein CBW65_06885 [Tumebacillus avium]|uniref:RNA polymerase sigma factor SigJ n=1 Tax=Tumebacillus avium TaxID=1903704 RepID=A0A1Y0IKP7_9BACL|nr:RNA polymerase sigma-70 factor [Tumebacillus avium]ARU60850.1 hypothetical protein CBW65_06885 [Tumebacillus avium]